MSPRSVALVVLWLVVCSPAAAQMPDDARIDEQWAVAPRSVFNLQGAWNVTLGAGVRSRLSTRARGSSTPTSRATSG